MATLNGADPNFAAKVNALIAASGGRVTLVSGVRDRAKQTALWNAALRKYGSAAAARKWVAPPGRSNHEKGIAVDLGGDLKLAARLAPQFGLHRPLANEAWHFEPVGSRSGQAKTKFGMPVNAAASQQRASPTGMKFVPDVKLDPSQVTDLRGPPLGEEAMDFSLVPGRDRRSINTQISSFLSVLNKPIDFTGQEAK